LKGENEACLTCISKIKSAMVDVIVWPTNPAVYSQIFHQEVFLVREALECAVFVSLRLRDSKAFAKNYEILKAHCLTFNGQFCRTKRQLLLAGSNLLRLIGEKNIQQFHIELELLPQQAFTSPYVIQPIDIEKWLTEGSYKKLLAASAAPVAPEFSYFMEILTLRIRNDLSSVMEYTNGLVSRRLKSETETSDFEHKIELKDAPEEKVINLLHLMRNLMYYIRALEEASQP